MIKPPSLHRSPGLALLEIVLCLALAFLILLSIIPWQYRAVTRAKVARARSDLKRLGAALDIYRVDHENYPPSIISHEASPIPHYIYGARFAPPLTSHKMALTRLTTPIAYLASVRFEAPFPAQAWEINEAERSIHPHSYWYNNYSDFHRTARGGVAPVPLDGYLVMAFGPESKGVGGISAPYREILPHSASVPAFNRPNIRNVYDPTNGLFSRGNIMRFGGRIGLEDGVKYYPDAGGDQ